MKKDFSRVKNNSLVSVVIPTHNREDLLPRALESVINQTYPNIEIIIVNDGSKDKTDYIIKNYLRKNINIKYIKHEKPLGGNAARNAGIRAASGEFIAGLDDDDEFTIDRIELLMQNYDSSYSLITSRSVQITKTKEYKTKYIPVVDLNTMLYFNAIGNQVLVKKDIIVNTGLFDESLFRYQDYDMWLRIIKKYGNAKVIRNVTQVIHYEHEGHSNNKTSRNFKGAWMFYTKHKHLMNISQRKTQLYYIYKLQNKNLYYRHIKCFLTFKTIKSLIIQILRGKYSL